MPPNYCEVKIYYSQFGAKLGRHRDAFEGQQLFEYYKNGADPFKKQFCQRAGSDVLICPHDDDDELVQGVDGVKENGAYMSASFRPRMS